MTAALLDAPPAALAADVDDAYRVFCEAFRELLEAVAEHDRGEAYREVGMRGEEDYLRRVFDLHWTTAKDWVREARLIRAHPQVGDQLASGDLSVDKLRSMAEVVSVTSPASLEPPGPFDDSRGHGGGDDGGDPSAEPIVDPSSSSSSSPEPQVDPPAEPSLSLDELLAMLAELNARQLAARAAEARAEAARRRDRWRTRHLEVRRVDGEGRLQIKDGALFDDDAAVVFAAFEHYAARAGSNLETGARDPLGLRYADALRAMADAYLARHERDVSHPLVVFHADAAVLTGDDEAWAAAGADHSPMTVEAIRRLACFCKVNLAVDGADGNPLNLGRTQRLASWQQEYTAIWRDGGCRGCGATVGLEIHHLREWTAECGLTDIDDLICTCRTCHHLQHDVGWRFMGDASGEVRFVDPTGVVRSRTRPHPRCLERPRPPAGWRGAPPSDDDVGASAAAGREREDPAVAVGVGVAPGRQSAADDDADAPALF
jgi:hypothetical protein